MFHVPTAVSQQAHDLCDHKALLTQGEQSCASHVIGSYCVMLLSDAEMWELIQFVIPKIKAEWKRLAFCMRYKPEDVNAFKKDSQDVQECCEKLFENWLTTSHGPVPKTYQTLLHHIKKIDKRAAVSEAIERELIEGISYKTM